MELKFTDEVDRFIFEGRKINAIKLLREINPISDVPNEPTGLIKNLISLKEAKDAVEARTDELRKKFPRSPFDEAVLKDMQSRMDALENDWSHSQTRVTELRKQLNEALEKTQQAEKKFEGIHAHYVQVGKEQSEREVDMGIRLESYRASNAWNNAKIETLDAMIDRLLTRLQFPDKFDPSKR